MAPPVSLVVDTDTGSDDAVALVMALRHPDVEVRAVTTVAGNVPVGQATRNALVTLEVCRAGPVPVHVGRAAPMLRSLDTAQHVHGADGMSGVTFPDPAREPANPDAVTELVRLANEEEGRHTLVTLGPLTNVAAALLVDPDLLTRFRRVVAMAGAFDGVGNVHRVGEFNVWADPEAAKVAVDAAGEIEFVGWEMSRRFAVITAERQAELRSLGRFGEFAVDINRCVDEFARTHNRLAGYDLPDPLAMAVAIDPTVVTDRREVDVDIGRDDAGRGGTFVDHRAVAAPPNARIVTGIDADRFQRMLTAACSEDPTP